MLKLWRNSRLEVYEKENKSICMKTFRLSQRWIIIVETKETKGVYSIWNHHL